jgi:hypothetical protein
MAKAEFREVVRALLTQAVGNLSLDDKAVVVRQCLVEA